jgi:hypothetical protein
MAARKPLVIVGGLFSELPVGDSTVELAAAPSGIIYVGAKLGIDGSAQISGNAGISTGVTALASGNAALIVSSTALASGNAGISAGLNALSSGNFAQSTGTTALASGNAAQSTANTALASGNAALTVAASKGDVTLSGTQTLTNKTLTSPTLTTPVLGTPTSGTLSSCTVDGTDAVGFLSLPVNSKSTDYTLVLTDSGKVIFHPVGDNNARTFTIPANSSVAYPIGTALTFINMAAAAVTIAITTDTLTLSPAGTTGSRTLAQYGSATCIKITSTSWLISGSGLT